MKNKSEQDVEITINAPLKFEVGDYISIIDEPITNKENLYKVIGHQNYNKNYHPSYNVSSFRIHKIFFFLNPKHYQQNHGNHK